MVKVIKGLLILACLCLGLTGTVAAAPPPQKPSNQQLLDQLKQSTQNRVRIAYHPETAQVGFIGTDLAHTIAQPSLLPAGARPEAAAQGFLRQYAQLFGLQNPASELDVLKEKTLGDGRAFVRFQQRYQGVPVFGAELIVQMDAGQNIISVNGETLPDLMVDTRPGVIAEAAQQAALVKVAADYNLPPEQLKASEPELWIYNPILLGNPGPRVSTLVWRIEITPVELFPLRELVLIDARSGVVVLNFNQIDTALKLSTYDANNAKTLPGTLRCTEANPTCSGGDSHEVAAHKYAGNTYNFYATNHSRNSIDNAGMTLISTVHFDINYDNAFWDGTQMVYGDSFGFPLADDVVGHELTHGVTEHESNLIYFYQSGAINESLSDVWGEFVDLTNSAGNDTAGVRWLVGEDISGLGAIRDMKTPSVYDQPDKMSSPLYYNGLADNGGVHTNSGVNNKAAYLLTDGGTFNGYTVTALGLTKVAKIYYEAQTNLLTSASNYTDLGNILYQACLNLVGQAGITSNDCQEVRDATLAVQMIYPTSSGSAAVYLPFIVKTPSGGGSSLVNGNFESGRTGWTEYSSHGYPIILDATDLPVSPHGGNWAAWLGGDINEVSYIQQQVTVPAGAPYLAYWHRIASEDYCGYDFGGVLINNTTVNLYTLCSTQNTGGWVKHGVNLGTYAGKTVTLQIRAETDDTLNSHLFIDDITFQSTPVVLETSGPPSASPEASHVLKTKEGSSIGAVEKAAAEFLLRPANLAPKK